MIEVGWPTPAFFPPRVSFPSGPCASTWPRAGLPTRRLARPVSHGPSETSIRPSAPPCERAAGPSGDGGSFRRRAACTPASCPHVMLTFMPACHAHKSGRFPPRYSTFRITENALNITRMSVPGARSRVFTLSTVSRAHTVVPSGRSTTTSAAISERFTRATLPA